MFETLHEADGWTLGHWRCCPDGSENAAEEVALSHEVVIPVQGSFLRERHGRETMASPLTAVLADAGDTYTVRHPVAGGDECLVLLLGEETLADLGRTTGAVLGCSTPRFRRYEVSVSGAVFLSAVRLLREAESNEVLGTESAFAHLVNDLLASPDDRTLPSERRMKVDKRHRSAAVRGAAYMATNYRSSLSLDEIASEAAYSSFHFARVFRRVTGVSPYRYVVQLRLRAAVDQLRQGERDLSRLALRLGFSSHSHMSAAFRKEFGITPSGIRARFR